MAQIKRAENCTFFLPKLSHFPGATIDTRNFHRSVRRYSEAQVSELILGLMAFLASRTWRRAMPGLEAKAVARGGAHVVDIVEVVEVAEPASKKLWPCKNEGGFSPGGLYQMDHSIR
jgi:hypothetical protein